MKILTALIALPLLLVQAPVAMAQSGGAACSAIPDDSERLSCYDAVYRNAAEAAATLAVAIESEQLIPARPSGRMPAVMTVACTAGVLSVEFDFAGNTMSALGRDAGLTLQLDLQAARSRTLPVNADNTALVIDNTRDAAAFLDSLSGFTNLTARVTPVNSRSLSVRFRIADIAAQIAPVRAACE
ncbi:hypothetical protein VW29_15915 [Devosia limi DSM 17137]|uniref:Type VI secretion system protein VasI n=1 Tax=Devosia limi DSM 17137 TaxID=1121477 RepID=A0A0F5LJY4_9HYPH|nr:hypothetical protein [Devosia limi]KKB82643.1 hypothetical protein VW29_15915 [Devosia limi DSM 17137]